MILDVHLHSNCSDGLYSPRAIARRVKELGLDGFALTDHNTVKGHIEAKRAAKELGLEFIPGIEVSSSQGHITGLFVDEIIPQGSAAEVVEAIKDAGGISVAVHPYDVFRSGARGTVRTVGFDYIEVFNARVLFGFFNNIADKVAREIGANKIVGSDAHDLAVVGLGTIRISELDDLYKGKVEIHKKEWAGLHRIGVEKTKTTLKKLGLL